MRFRWKRTKSIISKLLWTACPCGRTSTSFATTTIKSDFSGSVGMHTPFYVLGSVGNLFDVANVESGFVYTSDVVFADEPAFSVSVAGGKLRLSASLTDITIKSPNENTILNDIAPRGFFELPAATAPSGYTEDDFVGYVKTMAYDTAQFVCLFSFDIINSFNYLLSL